MPPAVIVENQRNQKPNSNAIRECNFWDELEIDEEIGSIEAEITRLQRHRTCLDASIDSLDCEFSLFPLMFDSSTIKPKTKRHCMEISSNKRRRRVNCGRLIEDMRRLSPSDLYAIAEMISTVQTSAHGEIVCSTLTLTRTHALHSRCNSRCACYVASC